MRTIRDQKVYERGIMQYAKNGPPNSGFAVGCVVRIQGDPSRCIGELTAFYKVGELDCALVAFGFDSDRLITQRSCFLDAGGAERLIALADLEFIAAKLYD